MPPKKRPVRGPQQSSRPPEKDFFYRPFQRLPEMLQHQHWLPLTTKPGGVRLPRGISDEQAFADAMQEVRPLAAGGAFGVAARPGRGPWRPAPDEDLEALLSLNDLVSGRAPFDLRWSDEYVEGHRAAVSPRVLTVLKAGAFPIQAWCDLHGLNVPQARQQLERFLSQAAARGLQSVLVVHGRGHGSPGRYPVLKTRLAAWLRGRHFRRQVLAFATAQPYDGGAGALYLLLRRLPPGSSGPLGKHGS